MIGNVLDINQGNKHNKERYKKNVEGLYFALLQVHE